VKVTDYVTSTVRNPTESLRDSLEDQFQRHTDHLAQLTLCSQRPDRGGYDDDMLAALIGSARQVVADTAQALRRMAEGRYGTCEHCTATSTYPAPVRCAPAPTRSWYRNS
jgi:DnaK suppressor protein